MIRLNSQASIEVLNFVPTSRRLRQFGAILLLWLLALPLAAREKNSSAYGMGLIVNVPFPEAEVAQVVQEIVQNGLIRGTKEYNKDEYISGATPAASTRVFSPWNEGGKIFYKVRLKALDPRNFKDSSDVGTLAVRYVVQPQGDKNTLLRIDARFVEDFRHSSHPSNGSVESAEYKDIHDHLEALELMKAQTVEAQKEKQERSSNTQNQAPGQSSSQGPMAASSAIASASPADDHTMDATPADATSAPDTTSSFQTLEERVHDLRRQVQRLVKAPGAPLQSAPFHTATTLQSLPAGTEVLIVVSTPYWFGVETHEGQHGWMRRDELEQIP
jgi:polyhydroxyalkanoate synthesis regulator phasin